MTNELPALPRWHALCSWSSFSSSREAPQPHSPPLSTAPKAQRGRCIAKITARWRWTTWCLTTEAAVRWTLHNDVPAAPRVWFELVPVLAKHSTEYAPCTGHLLLPQTGELAAITDFPSSQDPTTPLEFQPGALYTAVITLPKELAADQLRNLQLQAVSRLLNPTIPLIDANRRSSPPLPIWPPCTSCIWIPSANDLSQLLELATASPADIQPPSVQISHFHDSTDARLHQEPTYAASRNRDESRSHPTLQLNVSTGNQRHGNSTDSKPAGSDGLAVEFAASDFDATFAPPMRLCFLLHQTVLGTDFTGYQGWPDKT